MSNPMSSPQRPATHGRHSLRRRALAGTALTLLVLGGSAIGGYVLSPSQAAFAAAIQPAPAETVQTPDFADLAQKVSPAVVSIRVRETPSPVASSDDSPFPGLGELPEQFRQFFQGTPNAPMPRQAPSMALGSGFFVSG